MRKTITFLMALIAMLLPLSATADTVQCLVLTQNDGTVSKFALNDAPVVTYNGEDIVVTCGEETLTTALNGLTVTFGEMETTRINEVIGNAGEAIRPQFSFGEAQFEGLQPGAIVRVFTLEGKAVGNAKADDNGHVGISLGNLPKGVYILSTPSRSFKIKN